MAYAKLKQKFSEITRMKYVEQAKWFMNGTWKETGGKEAENIWKVVQKFIELDPQKSNGNELDEFWSHKLLESLGETLTVIALRERLKKIDLDVNGKMSAIEYLCDKYKKSVPECVDMPQGDNSAELAIAQEKLNKAQASLDDVTRRLADVAKATQETAAKEKALEEQKTQLLKAEAELKAAVDDLNAQQEAFNQKMADLDKKANDASLSQVNRSKAAAELAQLKQENPMPLRKAKITQEAALRKVEKQRKETEVAKEAATASRLELEKQTAELQKAEEECRQNFRLAEEYLAEVSKRGGNAEGSIWWLNRELEEKKKYLPKAKGGISK